MTCSDDMQYIEVPMSNTSQILDGFFGPTTTPDQQEEQLKDEESKDNFEEKVTNRTAIFLIAH